MGIVGDHHGDGEWPSMEWWMTVLVMVDDHPEDDRSPSRVL